MSFRNANNAWEAITSDSWDAGVLDSYLIGIREDHGQQSREDAYALLRSYLLTMPADHCVGKGLRTLHDEAEAVQTESEERYERAMGC